MQIIAAMIYLKLWIYDCIDYYLIYLALSLPPYVFGTPMLYVRQFNNTSDSSDSEEEQDTPYGVYISQFIFVFKVSANPMKMSHRMMHGSQLRLLVDQHGKFFLTRLKQYYPTLDTVVIKYKKFNLNINDKPSMKTKVLDVEKRYDIYNDVSCRMGVVF